MADKKFEKIEIAEDLATVEDVPALRAQIVEAAKAIDATNEELPPEQLEALETYISELGRVDQYIADVAAEVAATDARRQAALDALGALDAPEDAEVTDPETVDAEVVDAEVVDAEPVLASAGQKRSIAAFAAGRAKAAPVDQGKPAPKLNVIRASANVPDFERNQELDGTKQMAEAFMSVVQSSGRQNSEKMRAGVRKLSPNFTRQPVANIRRRSREFEVNSEMDVEAQFRAIMEASDERTRFSGSSLANSALTAAGGWCAPSETIYDLFGYETESGLFDMPEVTARRGGISFTKGPDFMTIYGDADAGFIQTEAQAIAGTVKPCYAIECPPFTEVRLDAMGFCVTAPLLTNAAYPELVSRVLNMVGMGHARRKSATSIARISTAIGAAVNWGEVGTPNSGVADVLAAVELQAMRIRQSLAMDPKATIEGVAPYWMRAAFRNELSRRLSLTDPFRITDAAVDSWFAERGIRLQYVYDYQMLGTGALNTAGGTLNWTGYPAQVELMLWPAGAFTRLVNDVIKLDVVYDHELLTGNEYTAAFAEEGFAIANTRGYGVKLAVGLNYSGTAGFPGIGAGEGITFAAA